jgi:hypothetical protein
MEDTMLAQHSLFSAMAMFAFSVAVEMGLPAKAPLTPVGQCADAEEWVQEHSASLPTTYDAFARYPVSYRSKIYAKLSLQTRAELWGTHLDRFAAGHDLTSAQKALVQEVRAHIAQYLEPDAYASDTVMYVRAQQVLGNELAEAAFVDLVPPRIDDMGAECSCSDVHGGCSAGFRCQKDGCTSKACGALGQDTCDGECIAPN